MIYEGLKDHLEVRIGVFKHLARRKKPYSSLYFIN